MGGELRRSHPRELRTGCGMNVACGTPMAARFVRADLRTLDDLAANGQSGNSRERSEITGSIRESRTEPDGRRRRNGLQALFN